MQTSEVMEALKKLNFKQVSEEDASKDKNKMFRSYLWYGIVFSKTNVAVSVMEKSMLLIVTNTNGDFLGNINYASASPETFEYELRRATVRNYYNP